MVTVVIPAYKPDTKMIKTLEELNENGFGILVVDDGSGSEYENIFAEAGKYAKIIHHDKNKGKGDALKTAFANIKEYFPETECFITADADGQHKTSDIIKVRDKLKEGAKIVITVRELGKDIPFRSKFGNNLSRRIYTLLTGHWLKDNQSGLRGFTVDNIDWLLKVGGSKYDYEMNVLYYADIQKIEMETVSIEAIYIDGNKSSHFNPVKDTFRIYKRLFKSAAAPLIVITVAETLLVTASVIFDYQRFFVAIPTVGLFSAVLRLLIDQFIIFNGVAIRTGASSMFSTFTRYIIYFAACVLSTIAKINIPLVLLINLIALSFLPLKYIISKARAKAKEKRLKAERSV